MGVWLGGRMSLSAADAGNIAGGIAGGGALAWWLIRQAVSRLLARIDALETKTQAIELTIAGDLPGKEDMTQLVNRLDSLAATLDRVKDMVTRLDEREKVRHERD